MTSETVIWVQSKLSPDLFWTDTFLPSSPANRQAVPAQFSFFQQALFGAIRGYFLLLHLRLSVCLSVCTSCTVVCMVGATKSNLPNIILHTIKSACTPSRYMGKWLASRSGHCSGGKYHPVRIERRLEGIQRRLHVSYLSRDSNHDFSDVIH
jgi:hypothetical protein